MKWTATLTLCLTFCACLNEGKVTAWNDRNKPEAAKYCAEKFPVINTHETTFVTKITDSTKYKEAEVRVQLYYDTLYKHDTTFRNRWKYILQPCLDTPKVIIRTVLDSAKMYLIEQERNKLTQKVEDERNLVKWLSIFLLIAFIVLFIIAKLYIK